MAFMALPPSKKGVNRTPSKDVCVGAFKNGANTAHTSISIPRDVLREAGLPDYPGAKFDILVGAGSDRGSVAIIGGPSFKAQRVGTGQTIHRLAIGTSRLTATAAPTKPCTYEVGLKQIIIHLPGDFVLRADAATDRELAAA